MIFRQTKIAYNVTYHSDCCFESISAFVLYLFMTNVDWQMNKKNKNWNIIKWKLWNYVTFFQLKLWHLIFVTMFFQINKHTHTHTNLWCVHFVHWNHIFLNCIFKSAICLLLIKLIVYFQFPRFIIKLPRCCAVVVCLIRNSKTIHLCVDFRRILK